MRLYLSLLILVFTLNQCKENEKKEIVSVPDQNFLNALLENGVDRDGDGQISHIEAESTIALNIGPSNIKDLTGIEAFINLDSLEMRVNPLAPPDLSSNKALRYLALKGCGLTQLDISENGALRHLDCTGNEGLDSYLETLDLSGNPQLEVLLLPGNEMTALNVSQNPLLKKVNCSRNRIQELDLGSNLLLSELRCTNNMLKKLDVGLNTALVVMVSCGNQLGTLDLSQNTGLRLIGFDNMPSITEVCVWTLPFPPDDVRVLMEFSPNAYFTTTCSN